MGTLAVTILLDADQFQEDGAVQHFMEVLGGMKAQVRIDGYALNGCVEGMQVR